jgi:hypothetical protein
VSCLAEHLHEPLAQADDPLSWESLATTVRGHARTLPRAEAEDLLSFADLLDGFAELEKD